MKGNILTELEWLDDFGFNLKALIQEEGITQREFADELGLDKSTISKYISGERIPSIFILINMAYLLDCGLEDLVDFGERIEQ